MSYDIEARFAPIVAWTVQPTPADDRKTSPFKRPGRFEDTYAGRRWRAVGPMPVGESVKLLRTELEHLDADNVVIQLDCDESQIRRDGFPRADARVKGPGVIVSFDSPYGPLSYPCDTFRRWEDNLRAIALALEALRKVDRYGVTRRGEQYTGWKQLPGAGQSSTTMTAQEAARFIAQHGMPDDGEPSESAIIVVRDQLLRNTEALPVTYRKAAGRLHPDRPGGSHDRMATLSVARKVLEQHHGKQ